MKDFFVSYLVKGGTGDYVAFGTVKVTTETPHRARAEFERQLSRIQEQLPPGYRDPSFILEPQIVYDDPKRIRGSRLPVLGRIDL